MTIVLSLAMAIALVATVMVVTRPNAVHALLYLVVSLLAVAVVFFLLGAPFAAALEVIIYAGAIMVLFVFVIMMLNLGEAAAEQEHAWLQSRIWIWPGLMALALLLVLGYAVAGLPEVTTSGADVDPREVGQALFTTYVLGVEVASMVLLAGLIGAYHLGRRRRAGKEELP